MDILSIILWSGAVITVLAVICGIIGIIGSIIPGLPGPPVSWVGLLLVFLWGGEGFTRSEMSLTVLLVMLALMILVTVMDYVLPGKLTKATGGSKYASHGANAGIIIGLLLGFITAGIGAAAMLLLPFVGAFVSELYWGGKDAPEAAKGALGAFLGLLTGTGVKLIYSSVAIWMIFAY